MLIIFFKTPNWHLMNNSKLLIFIIPRYFRTKYLECSHSEKSLWVKFVLVPPSGGRDWWKWIRNMGFRAFAHKLAEGFLSRQCIWYTGSLFYSLLEAYIWEKKKKTGTFSCWLSQKDLLVWRRGLDLFVNFFCY